jgi:hypothetical protein
MKLPRDVGANQLIKALRVLGYSIDHQRGSHIRIVTATTLLHEAGPKPRSREISAGAIRTNFCGR